MDAVFRHHRADGVARGSCREPQCRALIGETRCRRGTRCAHRRPAPLPSPGSAPNGRRRGPGRLAGPSRPGPGRAGDVVVSPALLGGGQRAHATRFACRVVLWTTRRCSSVGGGPWHGRGARCWTSATTTPTAGFANPNVCSGHRLDQQLPGTSRWSWSLGIGLVARCLSPSSDRCSLRQTAEWPNGRTTTWRVDHRTSAYSRPEKYKKISLVALWASACAQCISSMLSMMSITPLSVRSSPLILWAPFFRAFSTSERLADGSISMRSAA